MNKLSHHKWALSLALCLAATVLLSACGGSGSSAETPGQPLADPTLVTTGNSQFAADQGTSEFTPSPGAGLDIGYDVPDLDVTSTTEFIEFQWEHMQTCLLVSAQEPSVTVINGKLTPTDPNDDVVRHIDGQIQASSHITSTSATMQVRAADFDGSLGKPGSYLRSIMGRYLWLANGLAERDYPYACANES